MPAGEDFRSIVELMSIGGQRWERGLVGSDDLDPGMFVWGMRRQIDRALIPVQGLVVRFEFRGIPKSCRSRRYWWLVLRVDDIEVWLKAANREVDVVIAANLMTFTRVWLGYAGLAASKKWRDFSAGFGAGIGESSPPSGFSRRTYGQELQVFGLPQPQCRRRRVIVWPGVGARQQ
jgi:hypothetical protein